MFNVLEFNNAPVFLGEMFLLVMRRRRGRGRGKGGEEEGEGEREGRRRERRWGKWRND